MSTLDNAEWEELLTKVKHQGAALDADARRRTMTVLAETLGATDIGKDDRPSGSAGRPRKLRSFSGSKDAESGVADFETWRLYARPLVEDRHLHESEKKRLLVESLLRPVWRLLHRWTRMQAAKTSRICLRIIMVRSLMGLKCILSSDPASKRSRRLQLSTSNVFTYWPSRLPSEMGWGRRISHGRWSANSRMVVRMRICLVGLAYATCVRTTLYFRLVICSFSCVQRSPDVERRNSVWKRGMLGQTCLRSRRATWQQRWHLFNRRLRPWLYNCKVRQHRGPRLWLLRWHLMHSLALSLHQCYSPINIKAMAQALSVVK